MDIYFHPADSAKRAHLLPAPVHNGLGGTGKLEIVNCNVSRALGEQDPYVLSRPVILYA